MAIPQGTVNFQMALGKPGEQVSFEISGESLINCSKALATLTGLTKSKIIKGLKMALEDGDDD